MFSVLERPEDISKAQARLEATIGNELKNSTVRTIGFPGGSLHATNVRTDGRFWFWTDNHRNRDAIPRRLNWFGLYRSSGHLNISVEVNAPYEGVEARVAGFFARDSDTGTVYLMHSGKVGGGRKGVGQKAFLTWTNHELIQVVDSLGNIRIAVIVMPVKGQGAARSLKRYIDSIAAFKEAVKNNEIETAEFKRNLKDFDGFYSEARGRRRGKRSSEIDYVSRHGDVVDALKVWRTRAGLTRKEKIVKNQLIDMGVKSDGSLTEIFEVKTKLNRADLYTAIGQLEVHCAGASCKKLMVLPNTGSIPPDVKQAIGRLAIELIRYRLSKDDVQILKS